jgi:hypothetical protein
MMYDRIERVQKMRVILTASILATGISFRYM